MAAIRVLGDSLGVDGLAVRAGVVTGEVTASIGAVGEGMVAGDAVNTAARAQSAASPGTVWTDSTTRRLVGEVNEFDDAGEHELKGKSEPHQLWCATRVLGAVGATRRVDGLQAGLVGRDAEFHTLRELFHASAERRAPRMVLVSGAAGSGKTRLGWELRNYLDGLPEVVWWHSGRCLSYGDGVAFWALAEAVRQRLDSDDVQSRAYAGFADSVLAYGRDDLATALRHAAALCTARPDLDFDVSAIPAIWSWPLAVRCAVELGELADVRRLVAFLDDVPGGHLPAVLRASRTLATAQVAVAERRTDDVAAAAFDDALATLRTVASPDHLAHALLDRAA